MIACRGGAFAKPTAGAGGRGVVRLRCAADAPQKGAYVVEGAIRQHAYADSVFSEAVNTLRVYVCRERSGEAFVAAAAHRFGTSASAPVDNLKRGGLSALVDLETGTLGAAKSNPGVLASDLHRTHPDTGAAIEGLVVPFWREAKALALTLTLALPELRFVGWDLCVTADGPAVVEGNAVIPHPNLVQAHAPMLRDPRTRRFFADCGVITPRRTRRLEALATAEAQGVALDEIRDA